MYLHEGACKTNASPHWMLWALGLGKTGWLPDYLIKYGHVSIKSCHRYTSSFLHLPHLTKKSCDGKLRHFPQCGKLLSTFKRIISNLSALKNAVVLTLHSFCHLLRLVPEVLGLLSLFHERSHARNDDRLVRITHDCFTSKFEIKGPVIWGVQSKHT